MSTALPALLMQAARSAAVADGLVVSDQPNQNGALHGNSQSTAAAAFVVSGGSLGPRLPAQDYTNGARPVSGGNGQTIHQKNSSQKPSPSPRPGSTGGGSGKKKSAPLRRGKWTPEEEAYANRLIQEFKAGLLPLTDGTTLRTFLSKLLNCDPMRISKKFVGSNCIGKQVFRRRTADINRLTPEQIAASQKELSELERRFLERVAQTNRVKTTSGGGGPAIALPVSQPTVSADDVKSGPATVENKLNFLAPPPTQSAAFQQPQQRISGFNGFNSDTPTPPWLRPPANLHLRNNSMNNRAAAAGRAMLNGGRSNSASNSLGGEMKRDANSLSSNTSAANLAAALGGLSRTSSAALMALAALQKQRQQNVQPQNPVLQSLSALQKSGSTQGLSVLAGGGLSSAALQQLVKTTSAARLAGLAASNTSLGNLLKAGLSRDQLNQLSRDGNVASTTSLSNMMDRQSSFDALMSLDFQSLQSIDNLANLIQSSGKSGFGFGSTSNMPKAGMKNWSVEGGLESNGQSSNNLANARRLASQGRMDSLLRSLSTGHGLSSTGNLARAANPSSEVDTTNPNASFTNLLQNLSGTLNSGASMDSIQNLLGNAAAASSVASGLTVGGNLGGSSNSVNPLSALNLASMLRMDSSTGLSALRAKDGLNGRNSSVDDFLSLVASGDIPHQDPHMLNMPLQSVIQGQNGSNVGNGTTGLNNNNGTAAAGNNQTGAQAAASFLAQQQILAQAAAGNDGGSNNSSASALGDLLANSNSSALLLNQLSQGNSAATNAVAAALAQQNVNLSVNAFAAARAQLEQAGSNKRKIGSVEGELAAQNSKK